MDRRSLVFVYTFIVSTERGTNKRGVFHTSSRARDVRFVFIVRKTTITTTTKYTVKNGRVPDLSELPPPPGRKRT